MRVRPAIWVGAMLFLVAMTVASMSGRESNDPPAAEDQSVLTVQVTTPQVREWRDEILAHGSIAAWHEATVGAELDGLRLIDVRVDVGSRVAAGDLLARFDPTPIEA